jgi:hypothetical protein
MGMIRVFYTFSKEHDEYEVKFNRIMAFVDKNKWNQFLNEQQGRKSEGISISGQLSVDAEDLYAVTDGAEATSIVFGLTAEQHELFKWVYKRHYYAQGEESRRKRTFDCIEKVEWNEKEGCLHVFFDDGEWWHYLPDGTWY